MSYPVKNSTFEKLNEALEFKRKLDHPWSYFDKIGKQINTDNLNFSMKLPDSITKLEKAFSKQF